jgi:hypothetical protein
MRVEVRELGHHGPARTEMPPHVRGLEYSKSPDLIAMSILPGQTAGNPDDPACGLLSLADCSQRESVPE